MKTSDAIRVLGEVKLCSPLGQAAFRGIQALKEKQEREKGCEHCRGWDKRCGANFCPMCGRELGENNG